MTAARQVFISHDTQDAAFAHRLARGLHEAGVPVWIAPDDIQPGESWVNAIERGLNHSTDMVIVLTPAALESRWVRKETEIGIMRERRGQMRVFPLMVQRCDAPLLLSSYQMVSFWQDYDAGLRNLVRVLGLQPTQAPVRSASTRPRGESVLQEIDGPIVAPSPPVSTQPAPSTAAIRARLIKVLSNLLGLDAKRIGATDHLIDDLDLDELDMIEFVMMVEEEWNLPVPDEDFKRGDRYILQTVDDWVTYLGRRLRAGGG